MEKIVIHGFYVSRKMLRSKITFSLNSRKFFTLSVCIYQTNKESEWTSCNSKTQIKTKALNFVKSKNGESKCPPQKIMSQVCHDNGKSKNGKNLPNLNFTAKFTTYLLLICKLPFQFQIRTCAQCL